MGKSNAGMIVAALVGIVVGGVATGYFVGDAPKTRISQLLRLDLPMEQAIREVEVSIWETSDAIFHYMIRPSATALEEYKKQLRDVEEFMGKYKALIQTDEEEKMVEKFEKSWGAAVLLAKDLIQLRDEMDQWQEEAWDAVLSADDVIDYKTQPSLVPGVPNVLEKEKAVREVEESMWEAINAVNHYLRGGVDERARRAYSAQLDDVQEFWRKYKSWELTSAEKQHVEEFDGLWNQAVSSMDRSFAHSDALRLKQLQFWEAVHEADDIIDFEIQESLKKRLQRAAR